MNVSVLNFSPPFTQRSLLIPDDLVFDIFSRLPSKAITRFRCLSKLWASVLRSQHFTDSFLIKSFARPQLLFACEYDNKFIFFSSPQPENPEDNSYVVATSHLERYPSSYKFPAPTSGFSCCGFNLIMNCKGEKVICNPSTGQSLTLPRLKARNMLRVESYLGYEPIGKEFKVLSLERSCVSGEWISVNHQVLTLGTNKLSWRMVECCIPHYTSHKWICISGVIYYEAPGNWASTHSMVVCFDLRYEKFSFVNFMETLSKDMPGSTTLINYNGNLGLLMSGDSNDTISGPSKTLELWVLRDAGKNEWSKHVYLLPPMWKDVVDESMRVAGMVGVNEIVLSPIYQQGTFYVIYFNVERKTIRKFGIQGMEAFQGKRFYTYLNYVENVKLL